MVASTRSVLEHLPLGKPGLVHLGTRLEQFLVSLPLLGAFLERERELSSGPRKSPLVPPPFTRLSKFDILRGSYAAAGGNPRIEIC